MAQGLVMANNSKIIKAATDIVDHLGFLELDNSEEVSFQLFELLEKAKTEQNIDQIEKEIMILLYRSESTRLWMIDRLSVKPTRGATRGGNETQAATKDEDAAHIYPVWFGTNREPINRDDLSEGFTGDRSKGSTEVFYGRCEVEIPKTHKFGETGKKWWQRWVPFEFNGKDQLKINKISGSESADSFWQQISKTFSENPSDDDALVFLHGFNNSFEDAAVRAAQIGFDLRIKGQTAFFSWPSLGGIDNYPTDESSIESSEEAITKFLVDFSHKSGAKRIHLMAHSMGNRGLLKALKNIARDVEVSNSNVSFGHIILAAPDLDVDVFRQAKDAYTALSESTTIYTSSKDRAVKLSKWIHTYPRLGFVPPITVEQGINTITINDSYNLFEFTLGHSYFAEAEALLHDIFDLIRHNSPPADRQRPKKKATEDGQSYWLIDT